MQDGEKLSLKQVRQFLEASEQVRLEGEGRSKIYAWVALTLRQHRYRRQGRAAKGLLRQYLAKMTGLSRAQLTRWIQQYQQGGELPPPATGGIALPASPRRPTSNCWRRWMRHTKPSAAR